MVKNYTSLVANSISKNLSSNYIHYKVLEEGIVVPKVDHIYTAIAVAFNCFVKKDYDSTIKIIESLITLNNLVYEEDIFAQDKELYVILCKSYLYLNKHEEAAPYIDKALAHWGNDKDLMFLKGFLLEAEGKHDEADKYKYDACMASL